MTQDIYKVVTQDLLEHHILRSILEPLPLSDLIPQTHIFPFGVLLHEELEELEVHWTPNYLPYYIDGVYTTTTCTTAKTSTSIEPQKKKIQTKTGIHNIPKDKAPTLLIYHQSGEIRRTWYKQCHNNHH